MIIDFRVRPPYKSFLNMGMFTNPRFDVEDRLNMPVYWGRERIPSVQEKSMTLFMQEMDQAKIDLAVIIGRKSVNPRAYGVWIKTPNMDRLSREGVLFENCYTEGLPTVPCRRAMHTGRYTFSSSGWSPLTMEDTTIADLCWGRPIDTAINF